MKITDVKTYVLRAEVGKPVTGFRGHYETVASRISHGFTAVYVKIETDEGIVGWGESIAREAPSAAASVINELFKPMLLGRDPLDNEVLWEELFTAMRIRGHFAGYYVEALSGVDLALWDIKGKYFGKPVHKLLGGAFRDRATAYASSVLFMSPEDTVKEVSRLVEQGFRYVKVKIGRGYDVDKAVIKAIRDSLGDEVEIMVDANTAYNVATAIKVGRMLEKYDVLWFEEPVPPDNLEAYVRVSRALDIPIAAAETLFTKYQWLEFMRRGAMDIAMPDIARVGGITEAMKIASLADSFGIPMTFHVGLSGAGCRAATLQVIASLPSHIIFTPTYEYYYIEKNPLAYDIPKEPIEVFKKDEVIIPDKPGLGLNIDEEKLKQYTT
ncbi:mandelate racemase/muconate lactonizing enzyme family protein [Vulcanisaeta thermophila]|uniref:mandelate racemase/muconate lactonizing enzyme family protein n=1 Tax=Vulcanisaeta thermophila TaxID=867917 RepID=UPI000852E124|nr:mandelate racemase/muconate lactonizing enzyme family protein [Vulcanisaeta thermophila]